MSRGWWNRIIMVVRSFCCVWLSLVFLCGFAFMLTYLIRRRCDTLPHCAPIRRSTDKLSPLTCYIFAQTSVLFPNRCVYSDKVFFKEGGSQAACLDGPTTWEPVAFLSLWWLLAISNERERERATRSSPEFFRADIHNRGKRDVLPQHACGLIVHFFSDVTLGRVLDSGSRLQAE